MHPRIVLSALIAATFILLACPAGISPNGLQEDPNAPAGIDNPGGGGGGDSFGSPSTARPSGPIVGEYAGTISGTETRSDGVQFESVLNFVVRFDYPAAPVRITEIWESGETLRVTGIGVPIRREQVGIASLELRQFTVVDCVENDAGVIEINLHYERFSTNVNLPPLQSVGNATVRLIREDGGLRCELTRDWQDALSDVQSTWTASGRLERNGQPAVPALRGGYLLTIVAPEVVTDPDGNVISQHDRVGTLRLRFSELGRFLESQDPFQCGIGDPYPVDTDRHCTRFNAVFGIPNEALTQVRDVRYFPDGAFVEFEIFTRYWDRTSAYIDNRQVVEIELRVTSDSLRWRATRRESSDRYEWTGNPPPSLSTSATSVWSIERTALVPISPDHDTLIGLASGPQTLTHPDGSTTTSDVTAALSIGMDQDGIFRGCSLKLTPNLNISFCVGHVSNFYWGAGPESVWLTDVRYDTNALEFEARSNYDWEDPPGSPHHAESHVRVRITWLPMPGRLSRAQVEVEKTWIEDDVSGVWNASGEFTGAE